ncbi:hypothetical protein FRC12_020520 [Ceratobasidium sp. 428]|nr:hypothetical protein FRC12_020520 [Ceratobasidium sp. 428]
MPVARGAKSDHSAPYDRSRFAHDLCFVSRLYPGGFERHLNRPGMDVRTQSVGIIHAIYRLPTLCQPRWPAIVPSTRCFRAVRRREVKLKVKLSMTCMGCKDAGAPWWAVSGGLDENLGYT